MLDLAIFNNRLFSASAAAAFLNGLARFALMFLFVFYFQGVQGDSPILAGLKLAPLAVGMLIASPLAGIWADRNGSRELAVGRDARDRVGLGLMTTLGRDTTLLGASGIYMFIVGVGSGMFDSAEHGRDDGRRRAAPARDRVRRADPGSEHRRGAVDRVRARGRHLSGTEERPVQGLLRARATTSRTPSWSRSSATCTWPSGAWPRLGGGRVRRAPRQPRTTGEATRRPRPPGGGA